MPSRWTVPRVVGRVYRDVLAPLGFARKGNACTRSDNSLIREIQFYSPRWGDPETKGIQVFLMVRIAGLPEPVKEFRRDALWTHLEPVRGLSEYPRPPATDPPPADLIEDVAGPALDFLCHASDLNGFVTWAREIHRGANTWAPFQHVYPAGTAPLQAAAFAAALAGDSALSDHMAAAALAEEQDRREVRDFKAELTRVRD